MNMTYCRYQNTLTDLRDCVQDIEERTEGGAAEMLSREEFEALAQIAIQAQHLLGLIRERATFRSNEDLSSDEIHDILANIDQHACDINDA